MGKLQWYARTSRLLNAIPRSRSMVLIGGFGFAIFFAAFQSDFVVTLIFIMIVVFGFALSIVRLNNEFIYIRGFRHILMSVKDLSSYHHVDYVTHRRDIAEPFQHRFVEALLIAHDKRYQTMHMKTHEWVVRAVLTDPRITERFTITTKKIGVRHVASDVLVLVSPTLILHRPKEVFELAFAPKSRYYVTLRAKLPSEVI